MSGLELGRISPRANISRYKDVIVLSLCLLVGLMCGSYTVGASSDVSGVQTFFKNFVESRQEQTFLLTLCYAFGNQLLWLLLSAVAGMCIVGMPFTYIILLIKGIGLGTLGGFLYHQYALQGIGFYSLIIMPRDFMSVIMLLLAGKASLDLSRVLFSALKENINAVSFKTAFRKFLSKHYALIIFAFIASLLDAIMSTAFLELFSF